jgi:tRNA U34 5-carboxymethylaminomethyl modifying GTPase MnmE/TrmE
MYVYTYIYVYIYTYIQGELVRDGVRIALAGPPNAGKSSLMNSLARRPAAIVSPIAGTVRIGCLVYIYICAEKESFR